MNDTTVYTSELNTAVNGGAAAFSHFLTTLKHDHHHGRRHHLLDHLRKNLFEHMDLWPDLLEYLKHEPDRVFDRVSEQQLQLAAAHDNGAVFAFLWPIHSVGNGDLILNILQHNAHACFEAVLRDPSRSRGWLNDVDILFEYVCTTNRVDFFDTLLSHLRPHNRQEVLNNCLNAVCNGVFGETFIRLVKMADVNHYNGRPLVTAAKRGTVEHIQCLLDHGADPRLDQQEALRQAAMGGRTEQILCLLPHCDPSDGVALYWTAARLTSHSHYNSDQEDLLDVLLPIGNVEKAIAMLQNDRNPKAADFLRERDTERQRNMLNGTVWALGHTAGKRKI